MLLSNLNLCFGEFVVCNAPFISEQAASDSEQVQQQVNDKPACDPAVCWSGRCLKQQGPLFQTWSERWFVLTGTTLSYWKDDSQSGSCKSLDLRGATAVPVKCHGDAMRGSVNVPVDPDGVAFTGPLLHKRGPHGFRKREFKLAFFHSHPR